MTLDNLTERKDSPGTIIEWDPEQFDPDDWNDECLTCGTEIKSGGGRGGAKGWCPECDVTVWVL